MQIPDDILHNEALNEAISILPQNYNFEVRLPPGKTPWIRIVFRQLILLRCFLK